MRQIKVGDIWASGEPNDYSYCKYHITAVGVDKVLCYEHPFPHEMNTIETDMYKSRILDKCYFIGGNHE